MPEWAVYIETPGLSYERKPMDGFIAHLDYNLFSRGVDLQFAIFRKGIDAPKMIALPLGEGTLSDAMDRVDKVDDMFAGDLKKKPICWVEGRVSQYILIHASASAVSVQ